jgi:hypothetical protein
MATPPSRAQALLPQPTTPISNALEASKKLLGNVDLLPDCFLGFSKDTVEGDLSNEQLTTIGTPCEEFLQPILESLPQAIKEGMQSFRVEVGGHLMLLPLWTIMFWRVTSATRRAVGSWTRSCEWMKKMFPKNQNTESPRLAAAKTEAKLLLNELALDEQANPLSSRQLSILLSDEWLGSDIVDSMLQIVSQRVDVDQG